MSFRPKTKRRLAQLAGGGVVVAGLAAAGVGVQLHRHEAARQQIRADGMAAFDHGDYVRAIVELRKFLGDNRTDPPATLTLAEATMRVPRAEQANLIAARGLLVRYLEMVQSDPSAEHLLLDVYRQLRFADETLALADTLLGRDPDDRAALAARWRVLYARGDLERALVTARHLDDLDPTDVLTQEATLEMMWRLHRPPSELTGRTDALIAAHPNDPRFELLRAIAARLTGDAEGTRRWSAAAAARPSPTPAFTLTLAAALDRFGQWTDATDVLRRAVATPATAPPEVRAALVERLWEDGQATAALELLHDVVPSDPHADLRLLGLKGLLLAAGNGPVATVPTTRPAAPRPAELAAVVAALTARSSDPTAAAWVALVRSVDPARPADRRRTVILCAGAAHDDPENAVARYLLGRAYADEGEASLSLERLAQASAMAPAWAAPRLLIAQALLDRNQPTAALGPAQAAAKRDPRSAAAGTALALIAYRTLSPRASPDQIRPALDQARAAAAADPTDPRLPAAIVDLANRCGQPATDLARQLLLAPTTTPAQVHHLAAIAAVDHLDVSAAVLAAAAKLPTARPADALDVALALAAVGHADGGVQLLAGHDAAEWQLADLRFRDATGVASKAMADAWSALADANPADLDVQRAVLRSPTAAGSRPLVDRTIDHLHDLTGDEAVEWRLARARYLLDLPQAGGVQANAYQAALTDPAPPVDDAAKQAGRDAAAAVASSMADVTRIVTFTADPQVLWATALQRLGDLPAAADRLRAAVPLAPDDPSVPVRLARLLLRLGRFRDAADAVAPLAHSADALPPAVAADVAEVDRQAGQPAAAARVLAAAAGTSTDPGRAIPLAQAQAAAGDANAAIATFDRVNRSPAATVDSVRAAAWFKAARGHVAAGRVDLARLDSMPSVPPVQRAVVRGQFDATFGDPAAARSELEAAVRATPGDPRPWAALAGLALRGGDDDAAIAAANHGLELAPADASLSALRQRAQSLAALHLGPEAQPLVDVLAADPTNPAAVATLDALSSPRDAVPAAVDAVAGRNPPFAPAIALAIAPRVAAGRYDEAAALAQRAMDAAPADPSFAQLLTQVWSAADRPDRARAAADQWRARSLAAPQPADAALATADLRQGRPAAAVARLAGYVTDGTADDRTLATYARALSADGRPTDADALLRPLAARSPSWRQTWLSIIADTADSADDAARRIGQVVPLLAAGSTDDRVALANAWYAAGTRFDDAGDLRRGLGALDPLSDAPDVPVDAVVLAGAIHQQLGQLDQAEADYRRALSLRADLPRAMNNLAWVITLRHGDPAEARRLAERAVALLPADAAVRGTLGQVALVQGDLPAATDAFRAATALAPRAASGWAGLADAEARAGHTGDAAIALDRAESLLSSPAPPPSATTAAQIQQVRAALGRPAATARTGRAGG
jgi:tetratricopeptide (TPR) repeat protein